MNYQQAIDFIQSFPDSERGLPGVKPARSLKMPVSTMKELLQVMGNPQNSAKTIHLTGSKGKGSTATFIASILQQAERRAALFTSPHIHSYTERIVFDLKPIDEYSFAQGITQLKPLIEDFDKKGATISTFGILTALFFQLVNQSKLPIDWQIVEVGLGGRDDLTNVFDNKEAVVITPISLEHTAILGTTTTAIAENKAGIITPECLVVLAPQPDPAVVEVIQRICLQKKAELVAVDKKDHLPYSIQLKGDHQMDNAMTALTLVEKLAKRKKLTVSLEAIENGLATAFLPGRFEIIEKSPNKNPFTIVLDGAHNGDSAEALAKTLLSVFPEREVILIIGISQDKDLKAIWHALKHSVSAVIATQSGNYRSLSPKDLADEIFDGESSPKVVTAENIDKSLQKANDIAKVISYEKRLAASEEPIICICGSLYLVAEARAILLPID